MKKALFIDFVDSFSYNIVQELQITGYQVTTVDWRDFDPRFKADLFVFGPGPGHPEDYSQIFPFLRETLEENKKVLGICLGHQIIWHIKGYEISKAKRPMHGQKMPLILDEDWQLWLRREASIWVQRYNSLSVKMDDVPSNVKGIICEGELMMARFENAVTYQFHPESLGTKCRQSFFRPIFLDIL